MDPKKLKIREVDWKRKNMGIDMICNEFKKSLKQTEVSEDSENRHNINSIIMLGIRDGKSKLEVLLELSSKPEYQKYNQYFRQWIDDQYAKKTEIQGREQKEDEQERD